MKDYLPLIGAVIGAGLALFGVWLTQRRQRLNELERYERSKTDRLRERRVQLYLDIAAFLHSRPWQTRELTIGKPSPERTTQIDAIRSTTSDLSPRIALLSPPEFIASWDNFQRLFDIIVSPNFAYQMMYVDMKDAGEEPSEQIEWEYAQRRAFDVTNTKLMAMLRAAMNEVDTL